jgi:hypothetical protein
MPASTAFTWRRPAPPATSCWRSSPRTWLAASCARPDIVIAAGRSGLMITTIAMTTGMLLLWLWARLRTPGHLTAGILLIVVPGALALTLAGNALTASARLATAVILTASAVIGFRALAG